MIFYGHHKIHFVGIGGISMSALAAMMHNRGHKVSGSDLTRNEQTQMLEKLGIKVYIGHKKSNSKHADFIIYNGAISSDNPELSNKKPLISREQLLAEIESLFPVRIAVAGTHGKSTTTAMIYSILSEANLNPTVHNGAVMYLKDGTKSNYVNGGDKIFLTEACEFKKSFLILNPSIAVITNIDYDHVDCYKNLEETKQAFDQFAQKAHLVLKTENCPPVNYKLAVAGAHNLENARLAAAVAKSLGITEDIIKTALEKYKGIDRRFQKIASLEKSKIKLNRTSDENQYCDIIVDYAHHPAEIATTIQTANSLYRKFLLIFQPHTYTRTLALFDDFVGVLKGCECLLYKTYAAREKPIKGGRATDLAKVLHINNITTPTDLNDTIKKNYCKYDAIILTGAGDMMYYLEL